jgi:tetratricopeptide (TPR) repeat protein
MASLIPGYEYDIFISYRQKDNKGEMWVSEFVKALKTELASTFKEDISIYFDINPHDGLLETHDVDASLKEKLKCLIFIPILSRTYCDPKSFAWKNEFESFAEQASKDLFGLKVKLPNGNIATRVLPVRIHDLDLDDIKLCESIIGGVLRDIEFIYKSEGVNRPLRSSEDKPYENQNNTFYRDQVNKTALAIKEIILGLKGEPDMSVAKSSEHRVQERVFYEVKEPAISKKQKLQIGAGILIILIIAVLFVWTGLTGRNNLKSLIAKDGRIPVAVMPFQNMTNDTTWNVWQDGIQSILITTLSNSGELKVRQLKTVTNMLISKGLTDYASLTPSVAGLISKKLETNVNISGSIKQSGSTIRVNAQLVGTKTGEAFKSFQIEGTADNILPAIDSLSRMVQDFLLISVLREEELHSEYYPPLPTKSPDAYKYVIYGDKAFAKFDFSTAIDMYSHALKIDSTNLYGLYNGIIAAYINQGLYKQAKEWCLKAYNKLDLMNMRDKITINCQYAGLFETPYEEIRYTKQLINLDDQDPGGYYGLGDLYRRTHQYDKAIPEYEKSLEIFKKWDSKPPWVVSYSELGDLYHWTDQYKKEKKLYKKAEKDFPDDVLLIVNEAILALAEGDSIAANRWIEKFKSLSQGYSEANIESGIASIYAQGGSLDKAEEYYRKALSLEPENWGIMNNFAYILIDKDRNINEGLELIERALKIEPNRYNLFHWKGWGLYKQGKYKEALEFLEKADSLHFHVYDYRLNSDLEAAKKAVAVQN